MTVVETGPLDALASIDPFSRVDPDVLATLGDDVVWRPLAPGEVLVEAGTRTRELAVVVEGELRVDLAADDESLTPVAILGPGSIVGEMALLLGGPRSAAVTATRPTMVLDLTPDGLRRLVAAAPEVGLELTRRATERLRESQVARHLTRWFGSVPPEVLADVRRTVEYQVVHAGEQLCARGDDADGAYLVLSGRLRVEPEDAEETRPAALELGVGELVGELSLLDGAPRSADVVAVRDTTLARIPREAFVALVEEHPAAMLGVIRRLVGRARGPGPTSRHPDAHRSIVVLAHADDVDLRWVSTQLVAALGSGVLHTWSARIDSVLATPGIAQAEAGTVDDARLSHWLDEAEQDHALLLHEADRAWTPWTARAVRQADEVVVVARAGRDDASLGRLEQELDARVPARGGARRTLVLLHDPGTERPVDTARWLVPRSVDRHLHVRSGNRADLARLARTVQGTAIGLVLSGGGARGAAHLGVIRALHEHGVPIDMIGGTSMGSVMAMTAALEWPHDEIVPRVSHILGDLLDYTLPITSLLKGERITTAIAEAAGGRDIEDLWLPWFCVSTNLTQQAEVLHRYGDLATAARASVAIPGVLPPVPFGDDLLVDGGSMNNLPVDHMRALNPTGTVLAVDVVPPRGPSAKAEVTPVISGWGQLAGTLVPGRRAVRAPGIVNTMLAATIVAALRDRHRLVRDGVADLVLDLDLRGHGLLDFGAVGPIAEAGYEAAMPRIAAWCADQDPSDRRA